MSFSARKQARIQSDVAPVISPSLIIVFLAWVIFACSLQAVSGQQESGSEQKVYDISKEILLNSLKNARASGDTSTELKILIDLGEHEYFYGYSDLSRVNFEEGLRLSDRVNNQADKERLRQYLQIHKDCESAAEQSDQGHYREAARLLENALSTAEEIHSDLHEMRCLRKLSIQYYQLNEFEEMSDLNQKSLQLARKLGNPTDEMRCLYNIGITYQKSEEYARALSYYEDALHLSRELKKQGDESSTLYNMAEIYNHLGNYDKSLEYMKKILELDEKENLPAYVAMDLNMIGVTSYKKALLTDHTEFYETARMYLKKSLDLAQQHGFAETEIDVLNNLGRVEMDESRYDISLTYFQMALKKAVAEGDTSEAANIRINIGIVYSRLSRYETAISLFSKAISQETNRNIDHIIWEAYAERADTLMLLGEYTRAADDFKRAIGLIEGLRSGIQLEELKASFLGSDKRIEVYRGLVDAFCRIGEETNTPDFSRQAFRLMEQSKARAFLDRLESAKVDIKRGLDESLLAEEERLLQIISRSNSELFSKGLSPLEVNDHQKAILDAEEDIEAVIRKIRVTSPGYAALKNPQIISITDTQKLLPNSKSAFFAYSLGRRKSYLFVITAKTFSVYPLPPMAHIQDLVQRYLRVLSDKSNFDFSLGRTIHQLLIEPGLRDNIKDLIIIPDDILHYLPFETLWTGEETESPDWLIRHRLLSYAPSITSLRMIMASDHQSGTSKMDVLAFGDPYYGEEDEIDTRAFQNNFESGDQNSFLRLRYSGVEIDKIRSLFPLKKIKVFQRQEATESALKRQDLMDFKILHFATHGLIDDKNPARSSILLSREKDSMEDGFLQMREIFNLKLNADLVTLSACRTGLGRNIRGEGIVGLSQAFFYAGASSALISLWPVNDQASAQLMEHFYHHLRSSQTVSTALQLTKITMIGAESVSHPYYWASFVLSGNTDTALFSKHSVLLIVFLLLVLTGFAFLLGSRIFRHRKKV
ncbi:MAG: CHAT domain-containing protein [Candidatus Aminicenantes bacterium]|nr:CHAT domain-containing protein [Candidatus Aminicenantes bacterium]